MTRIHVDADGSKIDLELNELEDKFYLQAVEKFEQNIHWLEFDEFAFGPFSPIYKNERHHKDVLQKPLYKALEDMWIRLGIQQGYVQQ